MVEIGRIVARRPRIPFEVWVRHKSGGDWTLYDFQYTREFAERQVSREQPKTPDYVYEVREPHAEPVPDDLKRTWWSGGGYGWRLEMGRLEMERNDRGISTPER